MDRIRPALAGLKQKHDVIAALVQAMDQCGTQEEWITLKRQYRTLTREFAVEQEVVGLLILSSRIADTDKLSLLKEVLCVSLS